MARQLADHLFQATRDVRVVRPDIGMADGAVIGAQFDKEEPDVVESDRRSDRRVGNRHAQNLRGEACYFQETVSGGVRGFKRSDLDFFEQTSQ